jgi:hypothetical protein
MGKACACETAADKTWATGDPSEARTCEARTCANRREMRAAAHTAKMHSASTHAMHAAEAAAVHATEAAATAVSAAEAAATAVSATEAAATTTATTTTTAEGRWRESQRGPERACNKILSELVNHLIPPLQR